MRSIPETYTALVVGASGGIGQAFVRTFRGDPRCADVIEASRSGDPSVDLTDEATLADFAQTLKAKGTEIHALIIATGILAPVGDGPEKSLSAFDPAHMAKLMAVNAIGPALALKHFSPFLSRSGKTATGVLSARVGSIGDNGLGGWYSYRASKAALNQYVHSAAIELSRKNKESVCVALHPGTIETDLTRGHAGGRFTHSPDDCAANLLNVLDNLTADQTGGFFAYDGEPIPW